jgi:inosine/xanthosine triphosphatase
VKAGAGGTFNILHAGHKALISRAFAVADEVIVGLASDKMASEGRKAVNPFEKRKQALEQYLKTFGKPFHVVLIDDAFGNAVSMKDLDFLIASEWSKKNAEAINRERIKGGIGALKIEIVQTVLAMDFRPLSSTRVLAKEVDADGNLLRPLHVKVGTDNPLKVEAVRKVLAKVYKKVDVSGVKVETGVPPEPKEDEVIRGAMNRASAAIGDADLGVGIEAGLLWNDAVHWYFDVQYCAMVDSSGMATIGHGPGFWYPPQVMEEVDKGKTVNDAMKKLTGIDSIGHKMGAVGYLSNGLIDRASLTEMSVTAAFIPRIRPDLYTRIWRKLAP